MLGENPQLEKWTGLTCDILKEDKLSKDFLKILSSYTSSSSAIATKITNRNFPPFWEWIAESTSPGSIFLAAIFLVSVPVFLQAPLVRSLPWLSLAITLFWLGISHILTSFSKTRPWGDLLFGFALTWFAGSIYWGWLRWEPTLHLLVESIGLPIVLWSLSRRSGLIGNLFYLGSLLGTATTDLYFYIVNLFPHWRQLMQVDPPLASLTLQDALAQIQTPLGIGWIVVLAGVLLVIGILPLRSQRLHWWSFSGAVLSTILVDSLFGLAAYAA